MQTLQVIGTKMMLVFALFDINEIFGINKKQTNLSQLFEFE